MISLTRFRSPTLRRVAVASALSGTVTLGACDLSSLLDVEAPSRVLAETLDDPANASLLVNSAIADFECAFAFYALSSGLIGTELMDTQLAAATWPYDRRSFEDGRGDFGELTCNNTGNRFGVYKPISTARWAADNALTLLQGWTDEQVRNRQSLIATAAAYGGYSLTLLGEGFCSAAVDAGPELTSDQVLQLAEERFTLAIQAAEAAGLEDIKNMALVGRARVRARLGEFVPAAADAARVPTGFQKLANYTAASTRSSNHLFRWINRFGWASVDPQFYDGLEWKGVDDPRVDLVNTGEQGADAFTVVWEQTKYPTESSPIPIATWQEAQLILAEVAARTGNEAAATEHINVLHDFYGLPRYELSDGPVLQHIVGERKRELFLEGHHVYDILHFDLELEPAAGEPFPIKGGFYGSQVCLPLPEVERQNNPNI